MPKEKKENDKNLDETYCQSIGKSIAEILRYSLDEEFRKQSFDLLGVSSSQETETEITNRLRAMIQNETKSKHNSKVIHINKSVNVTEITGKENSGEGSDFSQSKPANSSSSTIAECSLESLIPSFNKRNWLQISSEKYAESIKRRKLGYHSQPLFSHTQMSLEKTKDSCNTNSECSSSSLSQEISEVFDDNVQYYKNKLKDLFKNDGNKYLRKNLKSKKHLSL